MGAIEALFTMPAVVETFQGAGPDGDTYAGAVTVMGFLDDGVVREQSASGEQLVSVTKFYCAIENADVFSTESRVTVNGRAAQVTKVRRRDASGYGGPSHLEVDLS